METDPIPPILHRQPEPKEAVEPIVSKPNVPEPNIPGLNSLESNVPNRMTTNRMTTGNIDCQSPPFWKKRLLSLGFVGVLLIGVGWATAPKARLSQRVDEVSEKVDVTVQSIVGHVDSAMNADIEHHQLSKADQADWYTIVRRIGLALIGNGSSLEEIRVLEQLPAPERIGWWTEYLLRDRRSSDYLAERWTRATVGSNNGPFLVFRRRKYVDWLADQLENNTPYDVWVRQLICAQGSSTDAPEVNFLTATLDSADNRKPDAIRLAGRTSRAFLAQRIDCLQCHQDYLGKVGFTDQLSVESDEEPESGHREQQHAMRMGEQADFHQLAAFFSGVRFENPFVGLRNRNIDYRVRYLNDEQETEVEPTVPYRRDLLPGDGSARERLAAWVTHRENKAFARAAVNRTWALLFGKPLVDPVDSIPIAGPFPKSLELLADDFASGGYDLQRLIRTIVSTQAFQRDSRIDPDLGIEIDELHEQHWAIFPLTQLRPEQVAASIHQASRIKAIDADSSIVSQLEFFGGVNDFIKAYGDRGDDEFQQQSVTIPQRLLVMNGSFVSERTKHNPIMNAATRIAELTRDDKAAVTSTYLSVLNRIPSGTELNAYCSQLNNQKGKARSQVMSNLFWVLFNSTEFQWNH
ncbi:MAG: DUF1553 domain-containing protein [Pirellula sp.]